MQTKVHSIQVVGDANAYVYMTFGGRRVLWRNWIGPADRIIDMDAKVNVPEQS